MITMISAFMVKMTPTEASRVINVEIRVPPAAVTAPPSAKDRAEMRGTLMPTSLAASVLTETARTAVPGRVKFNQSTSATPMITATTNATNRFSATVVPRILKGLAR